MQPFVSNRSGLGLHEGNETDNRIAAGIAHFFWGRERNSDSPDQTEAIDSEELVNAQVKRLRPGISLSGGCHRAALFALGSLDVVRIARLIWFKYDPVGVAVFRYNPVAEVHCHLQAASKDRPAVFLTFCDIEFDR